MSDNQYVANYGSLEEIVAACGKSRRAGRNDREIDRPHFIGRQFSTWEDVEKAVSEYWQHGLDVVQEMLYELRDLAGITPPKCVRRKPCWSADSGDELCYDRLRSGQDYWRRTEREETNGPTNVTIFVNLTTSGCVEHDEILWRGAAAIVLADMLEKAGYRVELIACQRTAHAYRNGYGIFNSVVLKRTEQPLDIASIVNGVSGWFYRTVCFQAYENHPATPTSGLGQCLNINEYVPEVQELLAGNSRFVLIDGRSGDGGFRLDRATAVRIIRDTMAKFAE